jgi:amphi-Trp domain-containing protein
VSDVKVQQKQVLSRQEAARFITALAEGLREDGKVTVRLGSSTLELSVADKVDWELEVEVDGDKIELEIELKWSTSGRATAEAAQEESDAVEPDEESAEEAPVEHESEDDQPNRVTSAMDDAAGRESDGDAADAGVAETGHAAPVDQTAELRRGRRNASTGTGKSAFNGVDTAAVRAWAAANGLTVSPRGRIKDEVLQAYRAAGN